VSRSASCCQGCPRRRNDPTAYINLIYLATLLLAVGVVTLGISLFQA
jgi:hypothetical protein